VSQPDPRTLLFRSFDQAARLVSGVTLDQMSLPTACREFDVAALLSHMVGVGIRIASVGRGESQAGELPESGGMAADGWTGAFEATRQAALSSWADDEVLEHKMELPFGIFSGAMVANIYTLELTVHSWDLASATDQIEALDAELAEVSLPVAQTMLPPEPRGGFIPFGAVVPVADDAPAYHRLAGYLGRGID